MTWTTASTATNVCNACVVLPPSQLRVPVEEAIESMVDVLGARCQNLLLCSTLDGNRSVGPGDCFSLHDGLPSETALFELPKRLGAAAVLIGTTAVRSVLEPDAADIALTRRLIAAGVATGIPVLEHILVKDNRFRLMRESLEGGLLDY